MRLYRCVLCALLSIQMCYGSYVEFHSEENSSMSHLISGGVLGAACALVENGVASCFPNEKARFFASIACSSTLEYVKYRYTHFSRDMEQGFYGTNLILNSVGGVCSAYDDSLSAYRGLGAGPVIVHTCGGGLTYIKSRDNDLRWNPATERWEFPPIIIKTTHR